MQASVTDRTLILIRRWRLPVFHAHWTESASADRVRLTVCDALLSVSLSFVSEQIKEGQRRSKAGTSTLTGESHYIRSTQHVAHTAKRNRTIRYIPL